MKKGALVSSIFLITVGLLFIFVIIPRQSSPGEEYGMPPALLPTAAMLVITVLAFAQAVRSILSKEETGDRNGMTPRNWLNLFMYSLLLSLSLLIVKVFGFIAGGIFAIAIFTLLMGERNPFTVALISIPPPLIVFLALRYGLKIPVP